MATLLTFCTLPVCGVVIALGCGAGQGVNDVADCLGQIIIIMSERRGHVSHPPHLPVLPSSIRHNNTRMIEVLSR